MADSQQTNDQYAALERLYSERRWAEVEASAEVLLAEIEGDLRSRVLLLLGHTRLYGYNDAGVAAEHYRQVLAAQPEALLVGIAQEGLNQCLAAQERSPAEEPSPADAMPWLEQVAGPAPANSPAPEAAREPLQSFPGFVQPVETFKSPENRESPSEIAEARDQKTQPIQPAQLSPKESAELAKGLIGVVIRPN
jgi:hypothetical protein